MVNKPKVAIIGHASDGLLALANELIGKSVDSRDDIILVQKDIIEKENCIKFPAPLPLPEAPMFIYEDGMTKKQRREIVVPINTEKTIGRNQPCPCGSGKKYKHCCLKNK